MFYREEEKKSNVVTNDQTTPPDRSGSTLFFTFGMRKTLHGGQMGK